jgi:hypothetical protein
MFERLDDEYSELSPRLLEAVGSLLRTEFSVSGDIRKFISQAVEKARGLVSKTTRSLRVGASNLLAKAAAKLRPESVRADPISRILG